MTKLSLLSLALAGSFAVNSASAIELTSLSGVTTFAGSCYTGCGKAQYDHSNIIDGDYGGTGNTGLNSWNSGYHGGYVQINFGSAYVLDRIELYGGSAYSNSYELSVSLNGTNWETIATGSYQIEPALSQTATSLGIKYGAVHDVAYNTLGSNVVGQYVRYTRTGGNDWGYLYEMDVQGHVAAPVPEPETYAMMMAGLGMMGWMARRRQQKSA